MDADEHGLRYEGETGQIISCAFEVLNALGHGLLEKPYENSLCVEFGLRGIPWHQQPRYDVVYKNVKVGEYVPDLIVFNLVVVDTKVIERITDHEIGQMLNYLKITGHPVGLILNFKRGRLEWKRVVNHCPPPFSQTDPAANPRSFVVPSQEMAIGTNGMNTEEEPRMPTG